MSRLGLSVFHPVLQLPSDYKVFDMTHEAGQKEISQHIFGVGRYNEKRPNIYVSEAYAGERNIHMGIDLFAPVGTEVRAFADGKILLFGNNSAHLDYGYTLVTEHRFGGVSLYALYGHLNRASIETKKCDQLIKAGELIAWLGDRSENGGWLPHLHFQLSYERPTVPDMPGVVRDSDRAIGLIKYPDPRLVLGPIY